MKRIFAALTAAAMCVSFAACARETEQNTTAAEQTTAEISAVTQAAPEWEWQKDAPDNQGLDSSVLDDIHSTFDSFNLLSSVIVKNGYIVDEYFKDGYDESSVFVLNSASKSVTSALIGIAIDKGYIESVDAHLSEYFPQVLQNGDARWAQITIRHLLAAILEQATGMSEYEFGRQYLFGPVGMDSVRIDTDAQGVSDGGNGIHMTPYDMARFGLLFMNNGAWQGEQILSRQWVADSTSVQYDRNTGSADYGYQWWVRTFGDNDYPAFFAQGHAGQYIFVVPQLELVIVFTSHYTGRTSIYWQLVNQIVNACYE